MPEKNVKTESHVEKPPLAIVKMLGEIANMRHAITPEIAAATGLAITLTLSSLDGLTLSDLPGVTIGTLAAGGIDFVLQDIEKKFWLGMQERKSPGECFQIDRTIYQGYPAKLQDGTELRPGMMIGDIELIPQKVAEFGRLSDWERLKYIKQELLKGLIEIGRENENKPVQERPYGAVGMVSLLMGNPYIRDIGFEPVPTSPVNKLLGVLSEQKLRRIYDPYRQSEKRATAWERTRRSVPDLASKFSRAKGAFLSVKTIVEQRPLYLEMLDSMIDSNP